MNKKNLKAAFFVGATLAFISFTFYFYQVFYSPNVLINKEKAVLLIPEDADIYNVLDSMQSYNYLEDAVSFMFVSKILSYQENIRPGRYIISQKMNNLEFVRHLRSGAQAPVKVTLTSVRHKEEIAPKLCLNLTAEVETFDSLISDPAYVEELGFDTITVATMFLPNTYEMYWTTDAVSLINRMKGEYDRFWNEERLAKAKELEMTPTEVSILASVVQAETKKNDEKPVVAGLYINRIDKGMPLESDPTVIFGIGDFTIRRVLRSQLKYESPYNTYLNAGLPIGPICIPELSSIDAVLNYERHNYIFMCAKDDFSGYHNFATNLRQHNRNARKWQAALNRRKIMK